MVKSKGVKRSFKNKPIKKAAPRRRPVPAPGLDPMAVLAGLGPLVASLLETDFGKKMIAKLAEHGLTVDMVLDNLGVTGKSCCEPAAPAGPAKAPESREPISRRLDAFLGEVVGPSRIEEASALVQAVVGLEGLHEGECEGRDELQKKFEKMERRSIEIDDRLGSVAAKMVGVVRQRDALWALLDDIDTLDDSASRFGNQSDSVFRRDARAIQKKRWDIHTPPDTAPSPKKGSPEESTAGQEKVIAELRAQLADLQSKLPRTTAPVSESPTEFLISAATQTGFLLDGNKGLLLYADGQRRGAVDAAALCEWLRGWPYADESTKHKLVSQGDLTWVLNANAGGPFLQLLGMYRMAEPVDAAKLMAWIEASGLVARPKPSATYPVGGRHAFKVGADGLVYWGDKDPPPGHSTLVLDASLATWLGEKTPARGFWTLDREWCLYRFQTGSGTYAYWLQKTANRMLTVEITPEKLAAWLDAHAPRSRAPAASPRPRGQLSKRSPKKIAKRGRS